MYPMICAAAQFTTGLSSSDDFDQLFDALERREAARQIISAYIGTIRDDVDREIALRLHDERVGESATNKDIAAVIARSRLQEIESLYGGRVRMAAARGRAQGNYSALRCFVREVRRARSDLRSAAMTAVF